MILGIIHIPKTGGVAVARALNPCFETVTAWHQSDIEADLRITILRDPTERLYSEWWHHHIRGQSDAKNLRRFVARFPDRYMPLFGANLAEALRNIKSFDFVLRFEHLNEDFDALVDHWKLYPIPKLVRINENPSKPEFTEDARSVIRKREEGNIVFWRKALEMRNLS